MQASTHMESALLPPSFGQLCVSAIHTRRAEMVAQGKCLLLSDAADIIDIMDAARLPKAIPARFKPVLKEFGDRQVIPPSPEQVEAYSRSIGWPLDGNAFNDFYERKGWMVGKTKMKDWHAACRYAKRQGFAFGGPANPKTKEADQDYRKF